MVGDLLNGRTIHSLTKLLALHEKVQVHLVSPELLKMPSSLEASLAKKGLHMTVHDGLSADVLKHTDVLYVTRVQRNGLRIWTYTKS